MHNVIDILMPRSPISFILSSGESNFTVFNKCFLFPCLFFIESLTRMCIPRLLSSLSFLTFIPGRPCTRTSWIGKASAGREPVVSPRPFKLPFLFHFSSVLLLSVDTDDRYANRRFADSRPVFSPRHQSSNVQNDIDATRRSSGTRYAFSERELQIRSLVREIPVIPGRQVVFFNANHRARCGGCRIRVSPTNTRL